MAALPGPLRLRLPHEPPPSPSLNPSSASTYCGATLPASGGPHIEPQYRQYPQITKKQKFESELISGVMWFWILWHCWHDPDAVLVLPLFCRVTSPGLILLHGQMRSLESQQMTRNKITMRVQAAGQVFVEIFRIF
ncbi:hypothetical protein FQN60_005808 [Etheostoma spectabile]|uniref:NADH dehydrogenase [ubiquinone] 1 beta subcomplex subunit 2, mitochondrial n=1 Tax=Etheostoma spectabile TaxID=54343 RepID=A0A5J5CH93_9PERO|nr:hypothetical protein FQN60_005808 [Etheostoma spectabile]